ncbi:MAG: tripartite tricarboxylate transporter TctB family protein [Pseudomonadota bacterium]
MIAPFMRRLFLLVASAAGLAGVSWSLHELSFERYPEGLDYVLPALLSALVVVAALLSLRYEVARHEEVLDLPDVDFGGLRPAVLAVGCLLLYMLLLSTVGFPLATLIFQVLLLRVVFRVSGWAWLLAVPCAATASICLLFGLVLDVPLPRGVGWFYALNAMVV